MRKIMLPRVVVILALIFGYTVAKSMAHEMMEKSGETSEVSKLLGTTVKNFQGEDLGTITDVVTGPEGRIAFAVLSYWLSADTQMRVAVPFDALFARKKTAFLMLARRHSTLHPLLFQRVTWPNGNWLKTSTDTLAYNPIGQRKGHRNDCGWFCALRIALWKGWGTWLVTGFYLNAKLLMGKRTDRKCVL